MLIDKCIGQRFGRLFVIRRATEQDCHIGNNIKVMCQCDCGNVAFVSIYQLRDGHTKSCGCLHREMCIARSYRHGNACRHKNTRLYNIWSNMRSRCRNSKHPRFSQYGGKGVTVCDEWNNFLAFEQWSLKNGYADDLTIDRIDNDGGYNPSNCRWISLEENSSRAHKTKDREKAFQELRDGKTTREIANKYHVDITTAIRWAYAAGLKPIKGTRLWQLSSN